MKNPFILSFILAVVLLVPTKGFAQVNSIFPFFTPEKPIVTPTPTPPQQEVADESFDFTNLKNQPLATRRKIVASQLDDISLRLNTLYDKTEVATDRLAQNKIDTTASNTALTIAATHLSEARIIIDSLLLAANDPKNENVTVLMLGEITFKDSVLAAETSLRDARTSIIDALIALKTAVSASIIPPVN